MVHLLVRLGLGLSFLSFNLPRIHQDTRTGGDRIAFFYIVGTVYFNAHAWFFIILKRFFQPGARVVFIPPLQLKGQPQSCKLCKAACDISHAVAFAVGGIQSDNVDILREDFLDHPREARSGSNFDKNGDAISIHLFNLAHKFHRACDLFC